MEEVQLQLTVITLISNKSNKCLHRMHRYSVLNNSCSNHSIQDTWWLCLPLVSERDIKSRVMTDHTPCYMSEHRLSSLSEGCMVMIESCFMLTCEVSTNSMEGFRK